VGCQPFCGVENAALKAVNADKSTFSAILNKYLPKNFRNPKNGGNFTPRKPSI
jgi:hypothetical protein